MESNKFNDEQVRMMSPSEFCKHAVFESNRLKYRGINHIDAENLVRWRSSEDVYKFAKNPSPISMQEHESWYAKYRSRPNEFRAIITHKKTNDDIGSVGGVFEGDAFELSYYIGEQEYRSQGLASEAIDAMMGYVLNSAGINKFRAYVHKDNAASAACVKKLGFTYVISDGVMNVHEAEL